MRAVKRKLLLPAVLLAAISWAPTTLGYSWPLKPFHRAHPIRGNFGDPRTVFTDSFQPDGIFGGGAFSFHNGLDISAAPGQPVYPVASGVAHVPDMAAVTVKSSGGRVFKYMHITPVVYEGQWVIAHRTVLGHVDGVAQHVHFSEIDGSVVVNPLGTHHLVPYRDTTKPKIATVALLGANGRQLKTRGATGSIELAAEVYDTPALPVPGAWFGYPVAPAYVYWSMLSATGKIIVFPKTVADFRYTIPRNRAFWRVYARGTYQNKPRFGSQQFRTLAGRFEFRLTPKPLDTRKLADGVYAVQVVAEDSAGNRTFHTQMITVCNADPASCTTHP
jgi:hypothetical protein